MSQVDDKVRGSLYPTRPGPLGKGFPLVQELALVQSDYDLGRPWGGTWEGVIYHKARPTVEQFGRVREVFEAWVTQEPLVEGHSQDGEVPCEFEDAIQRMLDPEDPIYQVNLSSEHPLKLPDSNPYTSARLWITANDTEVLLFQHSHWTGDLIVDIDNFLCYHKLLCSLAEALPAREFAWGEYADMWDEELHSTMDKLKEAAAMWQSFVWGMQEALDPIPSGWEREFYRRFRESKN